MSFATISQDIFEDMMLISVRTNDDLRRFQAELTAVANVDYDVWRKDGYYFERGVSYMVYVKDLRQKRPAWTFPFHEHC